MNTVPTLTKDDVANVAGKIRIGAAWDPSSRGYGGIMARISKKAGGDLDALAVTFEDGEPTRMAGIGNNDPLKNGTVVHSGDSTTGQGEGDDETIDLDLVGIDPEIEKIVLMVAAFKVINKKMGDTGFGGVDNVEFTVYDMDGGSPKKEFRIRPSLLGRENVCIVAVLNRTASGWVMRKLNTKVHVEHGNKDALLRAAVNAG